MTDKNMTADDLNRLSQALLTLTSEVWVLRDRQRILEATLERAGVVAPSTLDEFEPDPELADSLANERRALIQRILEALGSSADMES